MAAPVINSAVASPATVAPGGAFVVTISASDPDSRTATLTGSVTDTSGNNVQISVDVVIADPITIDLIDGAAEGFTITPRVGSPGVFDCIAP